LDTVNEIVAICHWQICLDESEPVTIFHRQIHRGKKNFFASRELTGLLQATTLQVLPGYLLNYCEGSRIC